MITTATLERLRLVGDPPVDALVDQVVGQPGADDGRDLLQRLLRGEPVPAPVRDYLDDLPPLPAWVDRERVERGQALFARCGLQIGAALYCASLPVAYADAEGARVLHQTGALLDNTKHRLLETGQMVFDVMTPGGLDPGGRGYRDARIVRLVHAAVRHLVASREPAVTRVPVNQEELLGVLLTFTTVVLHSLDRMGVHYEPDEAADYLHAWCVVGHLLGLTYVPLELEQAEAAELLFRNLHHAGSDAGRSLMAELLEMMEDESPRWLPVLRRLPRAVVRDLVGDDTSDLLAVPAAGWPRLLLDPLRSASSVVSLAAAHSALLRALTASVSRSIMRGYLAQPRAGERPPFAIPPALAPEWTMSPPRRAVRTAARGAGSAATRLSRRR